MKNSNCFKDFFKSIQDYRKKELLIFLIQNDEILLKEKGISKNDKNQLSLQFKNVKIERLENYLQYVKDQEESIFEKILINKGKW